MDKSYKEMGMVRCESDWSVHHREENGNISLMATSVDDITLASNSIKEANRFMEQIEAKYAITNNGDVSWLLGC
jgi:hypothetical protein